MDTWQALKELVFRSLYKMGYKIGQLFVQAGKGLFMQAIESGIRTKITQLINSEELKETMENVMKEEMDKAISSIAEELGIENDSIDTQDPGVNEVDGALENH